MDIDEVGPEDHVAVDGNIANDNVERVPMEIDGVGLEDHPAVHADENKANDSLGERQEHGPARLDATYCCLCYAPTSDDDGVCQCRISTANYSNLPQHFRMESLGCPGAKHRIHARCVDTAFGPGTTVHSCRGHCRLFGVCHPSFPMPAPGSDQNRVLMMFRHLRGAQLISAVSPDGTLYGAL